MRVTYLAPYVPHPKIASAGGQFFYHYLQGVAAAGAEVCLLAAGDAENRAAAGRLPAGVRLHLVPVAPRPRTALGRAAASFPRLPGGLTPGGRVLEGFRRDPAVARILARSDVVEIQWGHYLPLLDLLPRPVPATALAHDIVTQNVASRRYSAASPAARMRCRLELPRIRRAEASLLNRCAMVFVFAGKDIAALRELGVRAPAMVVDPYLEVPPVISSPRVPGRVLFVGALDRPENADGVCWLLEHVWPAVVAEHPRAELVIAGANPPPRLRDLAGPGTRVTGWVDDLDPWFRSASIFVAPLFTEGGLKFKLPQAMLHGLPVVATPVAAQGVVEHSGPGVFGALTASPEATAEALRRLIAHPGEAAGIGSRARSWAERQYDFAATLRRVLGVYEELARVAPAR